MRLLKLPGRFSPPPEANRPPGNGDFGWLWLETDALGRTCLSEDTYACAIQRSLHTFALADAGLKYLAARRIAGLPPTLVQGRDALGDFDLKRLTPKHLANYAALLAHRCLIGEYTIQMGCGIPVSADEFGDRVGTGGLA